MIKKVNMSTPVNSYGNILSSNSDLRGEKNNILDIWAYAIFYWHDVFSWLFTNKSLTWIFHNPSFRRLIFWIVYMLQYRILFR